MDHIEHLKSLIHNNQESLLALRKGIFIAVSNLLYIEYLKAMNKVIYPIYRIDTIELSSMVRLLERNSEFMIRLSENLISSLYNNPLIKKRIVDKKIFQNVEILKGFFDTVIFNDLSKIPILIKNKLGLDEGSSPFREKIGKYIFPEMKDYHIHFIEEESALAMVMESLNVNREFQKENITITEDIFVELSNPYALAPLYLNTNILSNKEIMKTISFVGNISVIEMKEHYILNIKGDSSAAIIKFN